MATNNTNNVNKALQQKVDKLTDQVSQLASSNSQLFDEVTILKNNYSRLVEDVSARLEVVHKKLFQ
jgi:predicted secreted Zn-dependent protease